MSFGFLCFTLDKHLRTIMGTNYYVINKISDYEKEKAIKLIKEGKISEARDIICSEDKIHIGKSSGGWKFLFNHNNWEYFKKDIDSLKSFLSDNEIVDEYGHPISSDEFWKMVKAKEKGLDGDKYRDQWDEIHPDTPKPFYMRMGHKSDEDFFGLRFSTSTNFS